MHCWEALNPIPEESLQICSKKHLHYFQHPPKFWYFTTVRLLLPIAEILKEITTSNDLTVLLVLSAALLPLDPSVQKSSLFAYENQHANLNLCWVCYPQAPQQTAWSEYEWEKNACPPTLNRQRWTGLGGCKLSLETNGAVKIYIAEELPLGSLPHVFKERDLNSTFTACNINASAGKREKHEVIWAPKTQASCFTTVSRGRWLFSLAWRCHVTKPRPPQKGKGKPTLTSSLLI